jgi:hypothetical protein
VPEVPYRHLQYSPSLSKWHTVSQCDNIAIYRPILSFIFPTIQALIRARYLFEAVLEKLTVP